MEQQVNVDNNQAQHIEDKDSFNKLNFNDSYNVVEHNSFDESLSFLTDYTISYSKGYLDEIFLILS